MEALWFVLVAAMLAAYVVFDGFDLGAGIVHLYVARRDAERRLVLRTIGPVWDGNEVWLIAAGGTLVFAFPKLYAMSFSGFYLPLIIVLWLLVLRGTAIEFRGHIEGPFWAPLWDAVFAGSSACLAAFFGVALGNVVRGVPLGETGRFFLPLWHDLAPGTGSGILDAYTTLAGLAALAALAHHGALWIAYKGEGAVAARARGAAARLWPAVLAVAAILSVATFRVQPQVAASLEARPWGLAFPALAAAGLLAARLLARRGDDRGAFLASCAFLAGMLASAAAGLYPYVLPAVGDPSRGLTARAAASPADGLRTGLLWWAPGILLVALAFVVTYRWFAGRVSSGDEGEGY